MSAQPPNVISESSHKSFLGFFQEQAKICCPVAKKFFSSPLKRTIQRMSSALPAVFYLPAWRPCPFVIRTSRTIVLFADYELACLQILSREMRCRSAHWCVLGPGSSRAILFHPMGRIPSSKNRKSSSIVSWAMFGVMARSARVGLEMPGALRSCTVGYVRFFFLW